MGQSTDAMLWYGLCWTEEDEKYYEDGLPNVVVDFMKRKDPEEVEDADDAKRAVYKLLESSGCQLVRHGYGDGGVMYGIAVKESYKCASRGYPVDLTSSFTTTGRPLEWLPQLKDAAEAIGWPWKQPTWWLASLWD